jgi:hypothetical protein
MRLIDLEVLKFSLRHYLKKSPRRRATAALGLIRINNNEVFMSQQSNASAAKKTVHYVIAVHGIGEQRKNETVLPVISEFAAARHNQEKHSNQLTLGLLASESTDTLWIELDDIPAQAGAALKNPRWQPKVATSPHGNNIRFLDFVWSGVAREQHPQVGETVSTWSGKLINRLQARQEDGNGKLEWIIFLMQNMRKGVLLIQWLLNLKAGSLSNKVFNDFLGDVELYGDFPNTRGRAVRLFHELMAELHASHAREFGDRADPQYTIIAHSLGTVMTLDAITYAHANLSSRTSDENLDEPTVVHFPGYSGKNFSGDDNWPGKVRDIGPDTPLPSTEWIKYLSSYVTLGSPIDKFLAMWTENYQHLNSDEWFDAELKEWRTSHKIRHFNYSDEQDPVGFELNILQSSKAWDELMELGEDVVFARYPVPGVAHVDYWEDYDLMYRILNVAIDNRSETLNPGDKPAGHYTEWFRRCEYVKGLFYSHVVAPIIGWAIATFLLQSIFDAWTATTKSISWLSIILLTAIFMKLLIMWRLLVTVSRREESPLEEKVERKVADKFFNGIIYGSPILWAVLLVIGSIPSMQSLIAGFVGLGTWNIAFGMALLISLGIASIYVRIHTRWRNIKKSHSIAANFSDYAN